jgi:peptidoglycan/xylan/chitin deacetylase (PgdA/CDA1 family)
MSHRRIDILRSLIGAVCLLLSPAALAAEPSGGRTVSVVIRYDDFSQRSDLALETRIADGFLNHRLPITYSVIPNVLTRDPESGEIIGHLLLTRERAGFLAVGIREDLIEIAQHGWTHQSIDPDNPTEFRGRPFDEQLHIIAGGKSHLEEVFGLPIETFVPPFESYDADTVAVLEKLGFLYFSSGDRGLGNRKSFIEFLPMTCNLVELRDAVEAARRSDDPQPLVILLFHAYDFVENSPETGILTLDQFDETLAWLAAQSDVECMTVARACRQFDGFDTRRLADYRALRSMADMDPPFLRGKPLYYPAADRIDRLTRLAWSRIVGQYLGGALIVGLLAFAIASLLRRRAPALLQFGRYAVLIPLAAAVVYALRDGAVGFKVFSALALLTGLCAGMWCVRVGADAQAANPPDPAPGNHPAPGTGLST